RRPRHRRARRRPLPLRGPPRHRPLDLGAGAGRHQQAPARTPGRRVTGGSGGGPDRRRPLPSDAVAAAPADRGGPPNGTALPKVLVTGSIATDYLAVFPGRFAELIIPD